LYLKRESREGSKHHRPLTNLDFWAYMSRIGSKDHDTAALPPLKWRQTVGVLTMRLVDLWARIGVLLLLTTLVALGVLIIRPRPQGRRIGNEAATSQHWFSNQRERRTFSNTELGAVVGSFKDAEMYTKMERRDSRVNGNYGLDVEDTCILQ
jgi:hypothetical protein